MTPQQTHAETLEQAKQRLIDTIDHYVREKQDPNNCGTEVGLLAGRILEQIDSIAALRAPVGTCETCQHFRRLKGRDGKSGDGECWNPDNPYCSFANVEYGCLFHTPRPETTHGEQV